jgi:nucleotide-binding universal stress UspA family protein
MYRILVPLDGSRFGEQALPTACGLAQSAGGELKLVHVLDFVTFPSGPPSSEEEWIHATGKSDAERYLQNWRDDLTNTWGLPVEVAVTEGLPVEQIQQEAVHWKADLIVLATHGHGAFDRAWIGSVADELVRESHTPVVLVRAAADQRATSDATSFAHILVALDGSNLAEQVLASVERLALASAGRITLLRVVRPWVRATRPMAAAPELPELREKALAARCAEARDYVARIASSLDCKQVDTDVIVAESSEAAEIIRYADGHDVDVIALATHGHAGFRRLLLGSVADKLIRGSHLPVLVIRPRD